MLHSQPQLTGSRLYWATRAQAVGLPEAAPAKAVEPGFPEKPGPGILENLEALETPVTLQILERVEIAEPLGTQSRNLIL